MYNITPTELRGNLYKILDRIIETGEPVEVVRNGEKLEIKVKGKKPVSKLDRIEPRPWVIDGDPDDLINLQLWEWDADYNMDPTKYPDKYK